MPGAFPALGSPPAPSAPAASRTRDPENVTPRFSVDQSKPTTSVQVRLADGTRYVWALSDGVAWLLIVVFLFRIVARMNLDHTVRDLRSFINA